MQQCMPDGLTQLHLYHRTCSVMPELPEVETTRRGIEPLIVGQRVDDFIVHQPRLRWPVCPEMPARIQNQTVHSCQRRGKYLLIGFAAGYQIIHLGMSGSLRHAPADAERLKHDHAEWRLPGARLLLHDPRRFGAILWHDRTAGPILEHRLLAHLGVEPLGEEFTPHTLHEGFKNRRLAIKNALLEGKTVVGVGNIYASEALFKAGIHPETPAGALSMYRLRKLHQAIVDTIQKALDAGGTTLQDYINATGAPGAYFDLHALVYGKEGDPCPRCERPILRMVQNQRATFYCRRCQRR